MHLALNHWFKGILRIGDWGILSPSPPSKSHLLYRFSSPHHTAHEVQPPSVCTSISLENDSGTCAKLGYQLSCAGLNIFKRKMCSQETRLHRFLKICSWRSSYLCLFVIMGASRIEHFRGRCGLHRWRQREPRNTREAERKWNKHLQTAAKHAAKNKETTSEWTIPLLISGQGWDRWFCREKGVQNTNPSERWPPNGLQNGSLRNPKWLPTIKYKTGIIQNQEILAFYKIDWSR